jgi:uncharacterized protein
MAGRPPDVVDCARLADEAVTLERVYALADLPRLQDALANAGGDATVRFAFGKIGANRYGAMVDVAAAPFLRCQRCLQAFEFSVAARSQIEFAASADAAVESDREPYPAPEGRASLRDLAEEELLLALPVAPACDAPETCGRAPRYEAGAALAASPQEMARPFGILQDLLKKP